MRFALVSDIHANRQAWQAVLSDIRNTGADSILCLGDVVGYGPMPDAVLESVCEEVDELVLGNHDAAIGGRMDETIFSDDARRVVDWTRMILQDSATELVAELPDIVEGEHFLLAHGEVFDPERFGYIETEDDARENFGAEKANLIFVGHTHRPGIFVLDPQSGAIRAIFANDFRLQPGLRYIVNVGSVGDPRDGLSTACYCMFDDSTGEVLFKRVSFDIDAYKEDLLDRGLDVTPYFIRILRPPVEGEKEPVEDWAMQMWAPPVQRAERPAKVLRVRHVDHGLSEEEKAAAAAAQARRRELAGVLKAAEDKAEKQRQARIEATAEALRKRQEAKGAAEKAAAEQTRQRKLELARSAEAKQMEKERERREARAQMEATFRKRRDVLGQKKEQEKARQTAGAGTTTVLSLSDLLKKEAEAKAAEGPPAPPTPAPAPVPRPAAPAPRPAASPLRPAAPRPRASTPVPRAPPAPARQAPPAPPAPKAPLAKTQPIPQPPTQPAPTSAVPRSVAGLAPQAPAPSAQPSPKTPLAATQPIPKPPPEPDPTSAAPGGAAGPVVQAGIAAPTPGEVDPVKQRRLAVMKAVEEKRRQRMRDREETIKMSRQMIQMKVEATRRSQDAGKGS